MAYARHCKGNWRAKRVYFRNFFRSPECLAVASQCLEMTRKA